MFRVSLGTPELAKAKAGDLISQLGIQDPSDIELDVLAWRAGAAIVERPLKGFEGRAVKVGDQTLITVNQDIHDVGKKRFIIAHELGHIILGHSTKILSMCTPEETYLSAGSPNERDANIFASNLLMPEAMFGSLSRKTPSMALFENLASSFRTTLTSAIYRYVELSTHRVAMTVSSERSIVWAKESEEFGHKIEWGAALDPTSYAIEFFKGRKMERDFVEIESKAWLPSTVRDPDSFIKELAVPMPSFRSVLTVVWIERSS